MGLRPARTCRDASKRANSRFSRRKPRKSYVKSLPHNPLIHYNMGVVRDDYEVGVSLVVDHPIQIRGNALESARMAVHKFLQKEIQQNYRFKINVVPHNVIRENKMLTGAGADRLQSGMKHAFGRPSSRAARITGKNQAVFTVKTYSKYIPNVKKSFARASNKLPGKFRVMIKELSN